MKYLKIIAIALALTAFANLSAELHISAYQQNLGQINDTIEMSLEKGENSFEYFNFPITFQEKTVILLPQKQNDFSVVSQSFIQRATDFQSALKRNIGKQIEIMTKDGGVYRGELLYSDYETLGVKEVKNGNRVFLRTSEITGYILDKGTEVYSSKPTISWKINTKKAGKYKANLAYMTSGLSWRGVYKAVLDEDNLQIDVMANINNNSGTNFENFKLTLVAGEPKKVDNSGVERYKLAASRSGIETALADIQYSSPQFESSELEDYYSFKYSEKINLLDGESKEVQLHPTTVLKPEQYYEYSTYGKKMQIKLKVENSESKGIGKPLPKGIIQVYKRNKDNNGVDFLGEDYVDFVPKDKDWIITLGSAFDLSGETIVVSSRQLSNRVSERDLKVVLKNYSGATKEIVVSHNLSSNWNIVKSSLGFDRREGNRVEFKKTLKPEEEFTLTWTENNQ